MPREQLRTDYPPVPHRLSGQTLNRAFGGINAAMNGVPILPGTVGPGVAGVNLSNGATNMPSQMTRVGLAIVTDASDDCPSATDEQDGKWAPCRSSRKYLAKFRKYAGGDWITTDEEEYAVDMGIWWPDESVAITSGPILVVDDIISVWLDPLRGMLVPLEFPRVRRVMLTAALSAGAAAAAAVLKRKSTSPWWQKVTGVSLDVVDLSLNATDPEWAAGTKGLAHWDEKTWLFVPLSCDPDDTGIV